MADEPEPPEHSEDGDIDIDVEAVDEKQNCNALRKNKGQWTDQEVRVFEKGLELFGNKWTKIADLLETRTAAQVKSFSKKFLKQKEIEESESLILISALTSSKVHLKMDETNEELDVVDSLSSTDDVISSKDSSSHSTIDTIINSSCSNCIKAHEDSNECSTDNHKSNASTLSSNQCSLEKSRETFLRPESLTSPNHVRLKAAKRSDVSIYAYDKCTENKCIDSSKQEVDAACSGDNACASVNDSDYDSCPSLHDGNDEAGEKKIIKLDCNGSDVKIEAEAISVADCNVAGSSEEGPKTDKTSEEHRTSSTNDVADDLTCAGKTRVNAKIDKVKDPSGCPVPGVCRDGEEGDLLESDRRNIGVENQESGEPEKELNGSDIALDVKLESRVKYSEISSSDNEIVEHESTERIETDIKDGIKRVLESPSVEEVSREDLCLGSDDCITDDANLEKKSTWENPIETNAVYSDIIPEDEATKICDALLHTLSPAVVESEPEEKYVVSIRLENLNKRIYRKRACRTSTRLLSLLSRDRTCNVEPKVEEKPDNEIDSDEKSVEPIAEVVKTNLQKGRKCSKYQQLPKRTTRHSKAYDDTPEKLIVSINLEDIDSYCEEEPEERPGCALSTYTISEGWMIQNERVETNGKTSFCVDEIFVDKEAFGVMKYRSLGEDGEVKEQVQILASRTAPPNYIWPPNESGLEGKEAPFGPCMSVVAGENIAKAGDKNGTVEEAEMTLVDASSEKVDETMHNEKEMKIDQKTLTCDVAEPQSFDSAFSDSVCEGATEECSEEDSKKSLVLEAAAKAVSQSEKVARRDSVRKRRGKAQREVPAEENHILKRRTRSQTARKESSEGEAVADEGCESSSEDKPLCPGGDSPGGASSEETAATVDRTDELEGDKPEVKPSVGNDEKSDACDENMNETLSKDVEVHIADVLISCKNTNATGTDNTDVPVTEIPLPCEKEGSTKRRRGGRSLKSKVQKEGEDAHIKKKVLRPRRAANRLIRDNVEGERTELGHGATKAVKVDTEGQEMVSSESMPAEKVEDGGSQASEEGPPKSADCEASTEVAADVASTESLPEVKDAQDSGKKETEPMLEQTSSPEISEFVDKTNEEANEQLQKDFLPALSGRESLEVLQADQSKSSQEGSHFAASQAGEEEATASTASEKISSIAESLPQDSKVADGPKENLRSLTVEVEGHGVVEKVHLEIFSGPSTPSFSEDLELNEGTRPRVSTSIMSPIVTSLNNELFGMNSCGLEFTLPGMSKDVLVKRDCLHGSIMPTNDIEDCLRLPPADTCSSGDEMSEMQQQEDLACESRRIGCEMQCGQPLVRDDVRLDCLSPYGDTSKFLNMDNDESNNCVADFDSDERRIDKFEDKDAFFSENGADSPFDDDEETEVNFKAANERRDEKWGQAIYNDDVRPHHGCLIDKSQLHDDPFINGDEANPVAENSREGLLSEVEDFSGNEMSDASSHNSCDNKYDLPTGQFENIALPTENFACTEELKELAHEDMSYAKDASEGYSSGSSSEDEDEDSDSSESDSDSSSSSSSSRTDDDDDDEDTDEETGTSDSESDVNEEVKNGSLSAEEIISDMSRLDDELDKDSFVPIKIDEVTFEEGEILPIERKECREFFMGKLSKTPEKYLQIRKFIVKEWNKIRPFYLTKNSIRSKVDPTDANAVGRVFMFLENYGAINVGCSIKNKWVERMERRRSKYFNAKRIESSENATGEQKRKRGRPSQKDSHFQRTTNHVQAEEEIFLDFNTITEEEKQANPQFFNGNKNKSPEKYLKMRNSIIYCWLDSKPAYLTKQAARMAMSWYCGDVNAISRVHDYLEQIGAINFGCAQEPRRGRPSRARMNQERFTTITKDKECKTENDADKDRLIGSKAARMKSAQKKLEDISREVELEMGKPGPPCVIEDGLLPFESYGRASKRSSDDLLSMDNGDVLKPKSKRGRKPKIRQCEPDSTVHDENLFTEKELNRVPPRNGLIPVKDLISDRESGPASDKSSVGDSGFDSVSEISPLLESDMGTIGLKGNEQPQDPAVANSEDDNDDQIYPLPTQERILDLGVITEEEKLGCPEFFVGSKVKPPEKYVKIRDSILKSWHDRKPFYLNKHNARCDMPWYTGDINSIGRVHAYLERVGAINYGAVQRPKRNGKSNVCRKRKLTDSPRYDIPSPETEEDEAVTERLLNDDMFNNDMITADEREAFKRFLTEGNGMDRSPSNYSKFRDLISDMWAKCKQKYLTKSDVEHSRFTDDGEDTNSDTGDDSYIDNRTIMNGTYPPSGRNGVWDMTKTFSLGLRPRKRWKMDINQDWIDRTESEGFTIKHLSPDEERMESRARPLSFANKLKKSLPESDPYKLVPCRFFPSENVQPFTVTICLKALLVMDFHSHLSSSEVIGLVGGKYYHASRKLEIMRVSPCSNVGTNLQCEMDPVSQAKASSDLAQHGLDVVGWYHSHPTFAPTPSLRDIDTQSTFQEWFSRAGAPFVGIIISPYNMTSSEVPHKSQITCLTISDQWDESKSYRIPYMFKFKTEDLDKSDSFDDTREQLKETMQTVEGCKQYLCQGRLGNTPPGLLLLKSFEAKLNRKTSKKDEVLSQVRDLIGI